MQRLAALSGRVHAVARKPELLTALSATPDPLADACKKTNWK